jgi:hypothetical protein
MIMCVLTLDQKSPKDTGSDGDNFKIATFLCQIKNEEVVYTLLWHKQGKDLVKSVSKAVANVAVAAQWLQTNTKRANQQDRFCVLGPNCCRIKEKVCPLAPLVIAEIGTAIYILLSEGQRVAFASL